MALFAVFALGCQKEMKTTQPVQSSSLSEVTAKAKDLAADPNFIKLVKSSQPLFNSMPQKNSKLKELYGDSILKYKECSTLAPKLGYKDSSDLVKYFNSIYILAPKIAKAYPNLSVQDYIDAIRITNGTATGKYAPSCYEVAEGNFLQDVTACAAFGLIPIIGEVLAGTCMIGALMTYNGSMAACQGA